MSNHAEAIQRRDGALFVPAIPSFRLSRATAPGPTSGAPASACSTPPCARPTATRAGSNGSRCSPARKHSPTGSWLPDDTLDRVPEILRGYQRAADDAGRRRHSVAQRRAPPGTRPLCVSAARPLLPWHGNAREAARPGGHGDLPGKHRGHLRGHRVPRGHARGGGIPADVRGSFPKLFKKIRFPDLRHRHQADFAGGERAADSRGARLRREERHSRGRHESIARCPRARSV